MNITVVYHKNCTDGTAAAWVADRFLREYCAAKNSEYCLVAADYDSHPVAPVGHTIILLDFSYDLETTRNLMKLNKVIVVDHHASALKKLQPIIDENLAVNRDWTDGYFEDITSEVPNWRVSTGNSGAVLAWQYFYGNAPVPELLRYVEDRDLWRKKLDHTEAVSWSLKTIENIHDFEMLYRRSVSDGMSSIIRDGDSIYRFVGSQVRQIANNSQTAYIDLVDNQALSEKAQAFVLEVPIVNANYVLSSDICEHLMDITRSPVAISYFVQADGSIKCSIRSDGCELARPIAEMFGGGGHPDAAGFYLNTHQLERLMEKKGNTFALDPLNKIVWSVYVQAADPYSPMSNIKSEWSRRDYSRPEWAMDAVVADLQALAEQGRELSVEMECFTDSDWINYKADGQIVARVIKQFKG